MTACPSENTLLSLLDGELDTARAGEVREHLLGCLQCEQLVGALATDDAPALSPGDTVGRYRLEKLIGGGEMGLVYEASDPDLGRHVALKLVRSDGRGEHVQQLRERLKREAQALAKLNNEHVVTIHDVGSVGEQVFIAMELVAGGTLRAWLQRESRSADAILQVFRQAGLGLAAAHRAGLVHRDFKPDNVLVADDGRVVVTDFGLAGSVVSTTFSSAPVESTSAASTLASATLDLTRTGVAIGTPAYMAPEQLRGGEADARSDIFAFSVALYEALHGSRPFAAASFAELAPTIDKGVVTRPGPSLSAGVWAVLKRGLAADALERWPSMTALLDALDYHGQRARRRRIVSWGATAAVITVLALGGVVWQRATRCEGADDAWGSVWDTAARDHTRRAFAASGRTDAAHRFALVAQALDNARASWVAMSRDACLDAETGGAPRSLLPKRTQCLAERRTAIARVVDVLAEPGVADDEPSPSEIWQLARLDDCWNVRALAAQPMPSGQLSSAAVLLREQWAEARAQHIAGHYDALMRIATAGVEQAKALGETRLQALLLIERGKAEQEAFRFADAEHTYNEAAQLALSLHDDATAADAWSQLAVDVGYRQERAEEGHQWARYAAVAIDNLGGDLFRQAILLSRVSTMEWWTEAKLEESLTHYADARLMASGFATTQVPQFAYEVQTGVLHDMGRDDDALRHCEEGMQRIADGFGIDHVEYYYSAANYAESLIANDYSDEAQWILNDLLTRFATLPEGFAAYLRADTWRRRGNPRRALGDDVWALTLLGDGDSLDAAFAWTGVGMDYLALDEPRAAIAPLEHAARIRQKAKLPTVRADTDFALAQALATANVEPTRARKLADDARATFTQAADRYGSVIYRRKANVIGAWLEQHQ